jgi:hypothetical protein
MIGSNEMWVQFSSSHSKTLSHHEIDWKTFWGVSWLAGSKHVWTQFYVWIGLYSRKGSKKEQAIYAARISANIQWRLTLLRYSQPFFFLSPFSYTSTFHHSSMASFSPNFTPHFSPSSFTFHQQFHFSTLQFFSLLHCRKYFFLSHILPTSFALR